MALYILLCSFSFIEKFDYSDALNLESLLTEEEIMIRYKHVYFTSFSIQTNSSQKRWSNCSAKGQAIRKSSFKSIDMLTNCSMNPVRQKEWTKVQLCLLVTCIKQFFQNFPHYFVDLFRDQVRHYCQEKLMPGIIMANRHEGMF